jgi:transposase-like protein
MCVARDLFSVSLDGLSGRKVLSAKVGYIIGDIYQFLNIRREIANTWIHQGVKCIFPFII